MTDATISTASLVADLEPYIIAAVGPIIAALGIFIAFQIKRFTGVSVDQATIAKVDKYVEDKAAQAVAAAADNLATKQIDVHSPIVADIANKVIVALPSELNALGLSPDAVASKVTSAFGRLQAQMTATSIPPSKDAAPAVKPANMP